MVIMDRSLGRIFLTIAIVSLVLLIGLLFIFGGHKSAPKPTQPVVQPLPSYAVTDAEVSLTVDGAVNGDDIHRQIRIRVDRYGRHLEIISGYSDAIVDKHDFKNTGDAYRVFLKSLSNSGFLAARKGAKITDPEGQCPLGERFIFDLRNGGDQLSQLWTTSCGSNLGTLVAANAPTLQTLFQAQITGYNDLVQNVNLGLSGSGIGL
jgi:hypothetical protein